MARGLDRPPWWAVVVIVVGLIGILGMLPSAFNHGGEPLSSAELDRLDAAAAAAAASESAAAEAAAPARIALPVEGDQVLFFGDSYTEGYAASPETNGYAYLVGRDFGWSSVIDAGSGSGYINTGVGGKNYLQRVEDAPNGDPRLIILQGGLNDQQRQPTFDGIKAAVEQVVDALAARYPKAQIVMLGPIAITSSPSQELVTVRTGLEAGASTRRVNFIDPITLGWDITPHLIADETHPDSEGHRYIADQLEAALRSIAADATATAPAG